MKGISKKMTSIMICVLFLTTVFASVTALKIKNTKIEKEENNADLEIKTKTITLYRHGLDGSVEPYEVKVEYTSEENLDEAIAEKCKQKFLEDSKFMDWLKNLTDKIKNWFNKSDDNDTDDGDDQNDTNDSQKPFIFSGGLVLVISRGKGFHFKPVRSITKLLKAFIPFKAVKFLRLPTFCRYNNQKAKTTLIPLARHALGYNVTKTMTGLHSTVLLGFRGWTSWWGFTSGVVDIIPEITVGISNLAMCRNRN